MSAAVKDRFLSSRSRAEKRDRDSWPDMARRGLLRCTRCGQSWLVVGARVNDTHTCKACSHSFVIKARV